MGEGRNMAEFDGVNLGSRAGGRQQSFDKILRKIKEDPCSFRAYMELGEWYEGENIDQAYLTYEHARYLCRREKSEEGAGQAQQDKVMSVLNQRLAHLKQDHRFHVHPASFIILSYNTLELTKKCLESIRATCDPEALEIVIVDNNSHDGSKEWLRQQKDIVFVDSDYNAGFPGGCNLGFAAAAKQNDMLLLNSDTEMTENAFYTLRMGLYADRRNGMAGGFSNVNYLNSLAEYCPGLPEEAGYYDYGRAVNIPGNDRVKRKTVLHAFYVLIRRDVFDLVGEWDELFNPGNYDDHDYSYRVLLAGYRNVVCWNSFIIHRAHRSFKSNNMGHQRIMETNFRKFRGKWHFDTDECSSPNNDMISLIQRSGEERFRVLCIGCGAGETLIRLEERFPNAEVVGVEKEPVIAKIASAMTKTAEGDVESGEIPFEEQSFDYVLIAHTLERCGDPELVMQRAGRYLAPGGKVICRVNNMLNARVIGEILRGRFQGADAGIRDFRNIHFFTLGDVNRLFGKTGYAVEFLFSIALTGVKTENDRALFDSLCAVSGAADRKQFDAHHYVFRLAKKEKR